MGGKWHSKLRPFKLGERHAAGMGCGLAPALLENHLAKLAQRKADFAATHPELGPMELRRAYWEQVSRRRRASERRERNKELNAFIRLVKESMKQPEFWDETLNNKGVAK